MPDPERDGDELRLGRVQADLPRRLGACSNANLGCTTNLTNDANNCGKCGTVCAAGQPCVGEQVRLGIFGSLRCSELGSYERVHRVRAPRQELRNIVGSRVGAQAALLLHRRGSQDATDHDQLVPHQYIGANAGLTVTAGVARWFRRDRAPMPTSNSAFRARIRSWVPASRRTFRGE